MLTCMYKDFLMLFSQLNRNWSTFDNIEGGY
jgi:hypothetical protein